MMLKNMGNATDSNYAGMKVLGSLIVIVIVIVIASSPFNDSSDRQVSLLLTRRWFYHAVSVFLQSVLLLVVAYTTFYYRVDNFQVGYNSKISFISYFITCIAHLFYFDILACLNLFKSTVTVE